MTPINPSTVNVQLAMDVYPLSRDHWSIITAVITTLYNSDQD